MKNLLPLMQREWLQHRFGWMMMVLVPLVLGLGLTGLGEIRIDPEKLARIGTFLPSLVAVVTVVTTMATVFVIGWIASLIIVTGVPRRDHGDRSVEFWLSLPSTHSESLAAPLIVHLLLVPAAALLAGLAGGWLLSLVAVGRVVGLGAWFSLPMGDLLSGSLAIALRFIAGLPLATLWLLPLVLTVMLMTALFRRWGWVILAVGLGLGSQLMERLFGQPLLSDLMKQLLAGAGRAMVASEHGLSVGPNSDIGQALRQMPGFLLHDFGQALQNLASPLLLGGLLFSAGCFALLVLWRQKVGAASGS
ncbi:MAG: hypothetical protein JNM33_03215 [Rubrivivax sp.]|nr:hypothetical protein [Rubrivivax sp.]